MTLTRRDFLKRSAATAGAMGALPHPIFRAMSAHAAGPADAIFLLVQLEGGNDGVNTVTPIDGTERTYYENNRINLRIADTDLLSIGNDPVTGDAIGLHPSLSGLHTLFNAGKVAVVNGVGYSGQSLSHFRSEDIWFGGISSSEGFASGWFGRYLDTHHPSPALVTLDADTSLNPTFFGTNSNVLAVRSLADFALPDDPLFPDLTAKKQHLEDAYGVEATVTSGTQLTVGVSGDVLLTKMDDYQAVSTSWSSNLSALTGSLASRLRQVASVIRHDYTLSPPSPTGARFFHVRIGGFDTHTKQGVLTGRHPDLLAQVSAAIKAFYDDMVALGVANKVVIMTMSEFGRRVGENGGPATAGSDHGAAAPLFVIGDPVVGGVYGRIPSMAPGALENGRNLAWHTDFRQVYATIIGKWLNEDPTPLLGGSFTQLGFLP